MKYGCQVGSGFDNSYYLMNWGKCDFPGGQVHLGKFSLQILYKDESGLEWLDDTGFEWDMIHGWF